MKRLRVLYLTNLPAPYTVDFLNELGKECELTVIYERHSASDRNELWKSDTKPSYETIYLRGKEIGTENSFCPEIKKYLKKDYDKIIIGMYSTYTAMYAIRYLIKKKKPYYISTDGGFVSSENGLKRKLKTYLMSHACGWFSPGKNTDEYLIYYGANKEKIYRYPFSSLSKEDILTEVPSEEEKIKIRREHEISTDKKIIIGVGQFIERKGWDILVDAINKAPELLDTEFLIIGGNEDRFRKLIGKEYPSNIRIFSFMSREELFKLYRASDIFVLPTREDIWGLVVNEAMACGLPVITTLRCNAGIEMVNDNANGYLVPIEDSDKLSVALVKIIDKDTKLMGRASLETVSKYNYEQMAKDYIAGLAGNDNE